MVYHFGVLVVMYHIVYSTELDQDLDGHTTAMLSAQRSLPLYLYEQDIMLQYITQMMSAGARIMQSTQKTLTGSSSAIHVIRSSLMGVFSFFQTALIHWQVRLLIFPSGQMQSKHKARMLLVWAFIWTLA